MAPHLPVNDIASKKEQTHGVPADRAKDRTRHIVAVLGCVGMSVC